MCAPASRNYETCDTGEQTLQEQSVTATQTMHELIRKQRARNTKQKTTPSGKKYKKDEREKKQANKHEK